MFWGDRRHLFTSLVAFMAGYGCGCGARPTIDELLPSDFHDFVAKRLSVPDPGTKGWSGLIAAHTRSEKEAFELFFRLRSEYERQKK
jgi:hypothetical protein